MLAVQDIMMAAVIVMPLLWKPWKQQLLACADSTNASWDVPLVTYAVLCSELLLVVSPRNLPSEYWFFLDN